MPRLCVVLPLGEDSGRDHAAVQSTIAALPADSRLVLLAGPGRNFALDDDPRITVEQTSDALSPQRAVNWALNHTDSELVARVEPADSNLRSRFRAALSAVTTHDLVYAPSSGIGVPVLGWPVRTLAGALPLSSDAMRLHMLLSSRVASGTIVGRRSVLADAGGYRDVRMAEYDLALRLALGPVRLHRVATVPFESGPAPSTPHVTRRRGTEQLVAEAYRDLSARLLGRAFLRLPVLASLPLSAEELEDELTSFQADLRRAARRLPVLQRAALHSVLRDRICAARDLHERVEAPVDW